MLNKYYTLLCCLIIDILPFMVCTPLGMLSILKKQSILGKIISEEYRTLFLIIFLLYNNCIILILQRRSDNYGKDVSTH